MEPSTWITLFLYLGSSLSFLGFAFMLLVLSFTRHVQTGTSFRMIMYLSLADFIVVLSGVFGSYPHHTTCQIIAFFKSFALLSSLFWTTAIGFVMYQVIVKEEVDTDKMKRIERYCLIICFGLPLIPATILLFMGYLGANELYCWIDLSEKSIGQFYPEDLTFIWWYYLIVVLDFYLFAKCVIKLRSKVNINNAEEAVKVFNRLMLYPLILVLCYSFGIIDRTVSFYMDKSVLTLEVLHVFWQQSVGFLNAIVYGSNSIVRQEFQSTVRRRMSSSTIWKISMLEKRMTEDNEGARSTERSRESSVELPRTGY